MKLQRYDIDYRNYNKHDYGDWCKEEDVLELENELEHLKYKIRYIQDLSDHQQVIPKEVIDNLLRKTYDIRRTKIKA